MRILVCGSRTYVDDHDIIWSLVRGYAASYDGCITVIDGACSGADDIANTAADDYGDVRTLRFPAQWALHGKAAGPIRNQKMLDEGKPDLVLAFIDKPLSESRGTADMVCRAKAAGLPVYLVERL